MVKDKDKDNELFYKKAKLFKKRGISAHIVIKESARFFNGKINTVKTEFCEIKDKRDGIVPIFYDEIFKFEKQKLMGAKDGEKD